MKPNTETTVTETGAVNSFETLTKSIVENERQMKLLAERVTQQRVTVLSQIGTAMKALHITTEDLSAYLAEHTNPNGDDAANEPAEVAVQQEAEVTQSETVAANQATVTGDVAETENVKTEDAVVADAAVKAGAAKNTSASATKPQTSSRAAPKFGGFGGARTNENAA